MTSNAHKPSQIYFLGLGSNIGKRALKLSRARSLLEKNGIYILKSSSVYETQPVQFKEQPEFLNQVVKVKTSLGPLDLMKTAKKIEKESGRKKTVRYGPRTLDIDILWWSGGSVKKKNLVIPHPRAAQRKFVLVPWAEIAGKNFRLNGKTFREWAKRINENESDESQHVILYEPQTRKAVRKSANQIASLRSQ